MVAHDDSGAVQPPRWQLRVSGRSEPSWAIVEGVPFLLDSIYRRVATALVLCVASTACGGTSSPSGDTVAVTTADVTATTPPVQTVPYTSTSPTATSQSNGYAVGSDFNATCTIAWPTAPVRTTSAIQMTTTCPGVPSTFQFVVVVYGDPKLAVSPSHATIVVRGKVVDIAQSEYGFKELVVEASSATVR